MATTYRPSCLLFDVHSVESCDNGIKGTSFWKEYAELKADFYTKFTNEYQHVVDKLRMKLENLSDEEDVHWMRSLKKELEREEAAIKLQEAYHKTYLKFTDELTEVEYVVSTEEQEFEESMKEFQKVKNAWEHLQSELSTKHEKISLRLDKFGEFLCRGGIRSKEKMNEWMEKFDKVTSDYDALILTERLKKQELLMLSHEVEQKYRDKETKRLSMITSKWKNCLGSLQENIEHFSAESNEVKGVKYAARIDICAIIKGTLKRESADYSDFKISKIIIARNPQVEEFLRKQKEELAAENTDIAAFDGHGQEESTKRKRRSKSRIKPVQNEESKKEENKIVEDKNRPDANSHDQGETTKRTKSKARTKPAVQSKGNREGQGEVFEHKNGVDANFQDHEQFIKRTKSKTRTKPVQNEENRNGQDEVVENKTSADVNVQDHQENTKRTKSKTRTKAVQKEEKETPLAMANKAEMSVDESDIVQPFNQEDLVLEDIDDISDVELLEDIKPLPRPLPSIPTTSGLKPVNHDKANTWMDSTPSTAGLNPVNHDKTNTWVDSTASEHSETEEETPDNDDKDISPDKIDTLPKEFVPHKAKVMEKYKKQRPVEMSVKRGDKVKVLIPPDTDGFVLVSKRTTFHLQKKKGYVPVSLLLPLNKK